MARSKEKTWLVYAETDSTEDADVQLFYITAKSPAEAIAKKALVTANHTGSVRAYELTGRVATGNRIIEPSFACEVEIMIEDDTEGSK